MYVDVGEVCSDDGSLVIRFIDFTFPLWKLENFQSDSSDLSDLFFKPNSENYLF